MIGPVRGQRSTRIFLPNNKPFLAVQPSHENTQHISAYRPSLERGSLMDGCCLLPGAAYEQGCSITHLFVISHDINVSKGPSPMGCENERQSGKEGVARTSGREEKE